MKVSRHGSDAAAPFRDVFSPLTVVETAPEDTGTAAMRFAFPAMLFSHHLTDKGLEQFLKDHSRVSQEVLAESR